MIRVQDVHKTYRRLVPAAMLRLAARLYGRRSDGRLRTMSGWWAGRKQALRGVSFSVGAGETVGIIGLNGAGKSTLLRILAGTATPTRGSVHVTGRVGAVLDLNAGLTPDRTGRQNLEYLAALYGIDRDHLAERLDDIIGFAGLGHFIDLPVRTYSTGMRARLAFSLATSIAPDVLLIDEALAVGDAEFVLRCRQRIRDLCARNSTMLLVSHNMPAIREFCGRVIWLDRGEVRMDGRPEPVIEAYRVAQREHAETELTRRYGPQVRLAVDSPELALENVACIDAAGEARIVFHVGEPMAVEGRCRARAALEGVTLELQILRNDGVIVFTSSQRDARLPAGETIIRIHFGDLRIGRFPYEVRLRILTAEGRVLAERCAVIAVYDNHYAYEATYFQPVEWRHAAVDLDSLARTAV